jgi:hypothetical protein
MQKTSLIGAGLIAAATFITPAITTPAMAQAATQEPGSMAQFYPDSDYLTGGYGARGTPGPGFYYRHGYAPGAATEIPYGGVGVVVVPSEGYAYSRGPAYYHGPGYYGGPAYYRGAAYE